MENNTDVVALRQQGLTLKEIGKILGVSRERVRQILVARGGPSSEEVSIAKQNRSYLRSEVIQKQVQMLMDQGIFQMSVIEANLNLPRHQIRSAISPDLAAKLFGHHIKENFGRTRELCILYARLQMEWQCYQRSNMQMHKIRKNQRANPGYYFSSIWILEICM